jgi:hypothetical protein
MAHIFVPPALDPGIGSGFRPVALNEHEFSPPLTACVTLSLHPAGPVSPDGERWSGGS